MISILEVHAQYVRRRTPVRMNTEAFGNAVIALNRQYQQVRDLKTQIISDLSDVELNSMENEWKTAYLKKISNKIDNEIKDIGPADALNVVQKIGEEAMSSPELVARYTANQDYNEFKKYAISHKNDSELTTTDCKKKVNDACKKYGINIQRLEYSNGNYQDLGDALYVYSLVIIDRPRSYRDWLYLILLSAKCGNDDAINQANDYQLLNDNSMVRGHSSTLFD